MKVIMLTLFAFVGLLAQSQVLQVGALQVQTDVIGMDLHDNYVVIDLSDGKDAKKYRVSELKTIPSGGWSDEYKTSKIVLKRIHGGTFNMGDINGHGGVHQQGFVATNVTISSDYFIGVFEITQRQWELVMGSRPSSFSNEAYYATRPVENVAFEKMRGENKGQMWPRSFAVDKESFIGRLRAKTGLSGWDLPTEAQWEYACRAGTDSDFNDGSNWSFSNGFNVQSDLSKIARCIDTQTAPFGQGEGTWSGTAAVGTYAPNKWGLYDMHGNASEMCLDWAGGKLLSYTKDPVGAGYKSIISTHISRGGNESCDAAGCSSWARRSYGYTVLIDQSGEVTKTETPSCSGLRLTYHINQGIACTNMCVVSFDASGGECSLTSTNWPANTQFVDVPFATRRGYVFDGWFRTSDGEELRDGTLICDNVTYRARWKEIPTYSVRFKANGGDGGEVCQFIGLKEKTQLIHCQYSKEGATFAGWAMSADGPVTYADGEWVDSLVQTGGDEIVLYAVWRNVDFGPFVPGEKVSVETGLIGYTVKGLPSGLKYASKTGVVSGAATKPTGDAGVTVTFTKRGADAETRTFVVGPLPALKIVPVGDTNGCKVVGAGSYVANKKVNLRATARAAKKTSKASAAVAASVFSGWYLDAACLNPLPGTADYRTASYSYAMPMTNVTLYAKFITATDDVATVTMPEIGELTTGVTIAPIRISVSSGSLPTVKVTGLPTGLKFTAKELDVKATKKTPAAHHAANTVYGTPTRSGVYHLVVTVTTAGKSVSMTNQTVVVCSRSLGESVLTLTCDGERGKTTGAGIYKSGKKASLKATANKSYVFAGWYEGDVLQSQDATWTMLCDGHDHEYRAVFESRTKDAEALQQTALSLAETTSGESQKLDAQIGVYVETNILSVCSLSKSSVTVSGLPKGLSYRDGVISGAVSSYPKNGEALVAIVVKNASGSKKLSLKIGVAKLPDGCLNEFDGGVRILKVSDSGLTTNVVARGLATFSVATTGKISGKFTIDGKAYSYTAPYYDKGFAGTNDYWNLLLPEYRFSSSISYAGEDIPVRMLISSEDFGDIKTEGTIVSGATWTGIAVNDDPYDGDGYYIDCDLTKRQFGTGRTATVSFDYQSIAVTLKTPVYPPAPEMNVDIMSNEDPRLGDGDKVSLKVAKTGAVTIAAVIGGRSYSASSVLQWTGAMFDWDSAAIGGQRLSGTSATVTCREDIKDCKCGTYVIIPSGEKGKAVYSAYVSFDVNLQLAFLMKGVVNRSRKTLSVTVSNMTTENPELIPDSLLTVEY